MHVRWADEDESEAKAPRSHYSIDHWARGTTETMVKLDYLDEPIVVLIDHGSEINVMAKSVYNKGKWPINLEHGWMIRTTNNTRGGLYGACPNVKMKIGDVAVDQKIFVQEKTSFSIILGQPFVTVVRMETKVLDDGSVYARIRSKDGKHVVQFLTVHVNHDRNREHLRRMPLPQPTEEFEDFQEVPS